VTFTAVKILIMYVTILNVYRITYLENAWLAERFDGESAGFRG